MSPTFLVFFSMLAAFLLITLAAVMRWVWHLYRPPRQPTAIGVANPEETSALTDGLLLVGVATAWYSVAMGWGGQFTAYPIYADLARVGPEAFHAFGHGYLSRVAVVLLPLGVMCLAWGLLLWLPHRNVPRRTVWAIVGLCVGFIAVTPFAAIAQDQMQAQGFSETLYARLMWSNGIRSGLFTAIGLLSLAAVRSRWTRRSSHDQGA
jgi:hypothetical protein